MKKRTILVTNDDGIYAPGLRALVDVVRPMGKVVVIAPKSPQSGMGHAITINQPLRVNAVDHFKDIEAYECTGTPADCVKLAKAEILKQKPDLCVSGINHGSNSSINVIYYGTMSAAMEASIEGIQAIGFSLLSWDEKASMETSKHFASIIVGKVLRNNLPDGVLLNVNIPNTTIENIKGIKVARQADAKWVEEYDVRKDPMGKKYYWLKGEFVNFDRGDDTDEWALSNNYISVVPVQFDLTAYNGIKKINEIML